MSSKSPNLKSKLFLFNVVNGVIVASVISFVLSSMVKIFKGGSVEHVIISTWIMFSLLSLGNALGHFFRSLRENSIGELPIYDSKVSFWKLLLILPVLTFLLYEKRILI